MKTSLTRSLLSGNSHPSLRGSREYSDSKDIQGRIGCPKWGRKGLRRGYLHGRALVGFIMFPRNESFPLIQKRTEWAHRKIGKVVEGVT